MLPGGLLQLRNPSNCLVQDDAVQDDDDHYGNYAQHRGEDDQWGWGKANEPADATVLGVTAPSECGQESDDETWRLGMEMDQ